MFNGSVVMFNVCVTCTDPHFPPYNENVALRSKVLLMLLYIVCEDVELLDIVLHMFDMLTDNWYKNVTITMAVLNKPLKDIL